MDSLQEKLVVSDVELEIIDDVASYANELNEGSEYKVKASVKKAVDRHHAWKQEEY